MEEDVEEDDAMGKRGQYDFCVFFFRKSFETRACRERWSRGAKGFGVRYSDISRVNPGKKGRRKEKKEGGQSERNRTLDGKHEVVVPIPARVKGGVLADDKALWVPSVHAKPLKPPTDTRRRLPLSSLTTPISFLLYHAVATASYSCWGGMEKKRGRASG